jgi:hypothetical protein
MARNLVMTSFKLLLAAPIQFSFPSSPRRPSTKKRHKNRNGWKKNKNSRGLCLRDKGKKIELIRQIETRSTLIVVIQTISERSKKKKNINPKK